MDLHCPSSYLIETLRQVCEVLTKITYPSLYSISLPLEVQVYRANKDPLVYYLKAGLI